MTQRSRPTDQDSLSQWELFQNTPRERRRNVVSEFETIYGEAPSGAHVAEPRWVIWREIRDASGRIEIEWAQDGRNDLLWIYNEIAFNPPFDPSGIPYYIELDNHIVYDGMGAGLPVANITVFDADDTVHTITDIYDPFGKFEVVGTVLKLTDSVQLIDIAYPLRLRAVDDDGNSYDQMFAIYVQEMPPGTPATFIGELNDFQENLAVPAAAEVTLIDYTLPAERSLRMRLVDCFGRNPAKWTVEIEGAKEGEKETYWTYYETSFDFENFEITSGQNIKVKVTNLGDSTGCFNARLRGYQYAE